MTIIQADTVPDGEASVCQGINNVGKNKLTGFFLMHLLVQYCTLMFGFSLQLCLCFLFVLV